MIHISQEFLIALQTVFPAFLFIILLSAFIKRENRASSPSSSESSGIVPVIIPIFRVRFKLTSILLALLDLTFVLSLVLLLVYYHGVPPMLAVWFSASNIVIWGPAAVLVWIKRGKPVSEFVWAKAMGWVGLIGTVLIGSERISQFVQDTKDPQTEFPLPFFILLSIYSVRLLLLILILWALHNPSQDFVPAVRRATANASANSSNEEDAPLLSQSRDHSGIEEQGVQAEGVSYGTFNAVPESEFASDLGGKKSSKSPVKDLVGSNTETDESDPSKQSVPSVPKTDEQVESRPSDTHKSDDVVADTSSSPEANPVISSSRPFSYAEAVTHPAPAVNNSEDGPKPSADTPGAKKDIPVEGESDPTSSMSTTSSTPKNTSTEPNVTVPSSQSNEHTPGLKSEPIQDPISVPKTGPSVKSGVVFPTSTSPVASFDLPLRQSEDSPRLSTDSADFSPGGSKERSKKIGTTLADVGRRVSNESNKLVRRISLINKSKSGSSPGGSANASPSRSPLSLPRELDLVEPDVLDTTQGEEVGGASASGSPIAKRFALLTRKSSSASSTGRIPPGLQDDSTQGLTSPALEGASEQASSPNGSISGSGSGSGNKKKKRKSGKNSKGKKTTKNKK